ncbi:hypothetical protein E2C01_084869 [Portunus trituberculatus]|uniref:Uncharacterized protein n=1 Tax=Portunus trituberculatus TaxID=210409 RepID=A0A5B7J7D5_PORTR|nr:hypothetical protein [Portunus trituberculatus]
MQAGTVRGKDSWHRQAATPPHSHAPVCLPACLPCAFIVWYNCWRASSRGGGRCPRKKTSVVYARPVRPERHSTRPECHAGLMSECPTVDGLTHQYK